MEKNVKLMLTIRMLLESNGVTEEQLRANKEVKVGKRREPKSLYEALASQLQPESSETIKVSSRLTNIGTPEHQAPAAQMSK